MKKCVSLLLAVVLMLCALSIGAYADQLETADAAFGKPEAIDGKPDNGWKNAKNETVGNSAMWQETLILLNGNEVSWHVGEEHSYKKWMISQMKEE